MPQADPIVRADRVQLINDDFSTDKRERVANYIEQNWNENNGLTLTEIAEETGTSRQHVKNVLADHFKMVNDMDDNRSPQPAIPERDEVDPVLLQKILTAYRIGCRDASSDDIDQGISEELLELAKLD